MKNLYNYDYRADTTTCQFNNTIWLFGCSNIYGYDLEEEQTAAAVLEKMINIPVINLGITGGNVFNIKHNLSELLKSHTPGAIIIAWPRPTRWVDPDGFNWGNWFFDEFIDSMPGLTDIPLDLVRFEEYKELLFSGKLETLTYDCIHDIREMIKNYPSIEFVYTSPKLPPPVETNMIHYVDHMPDNIHPGPETNIKAAEWLAEQLKALNVTKSI
jgi:hypothetical protein